MLWVSFLAGLAAVGFIFLCATVLISGWQDATRQGDTAANNMADMIAHDTARTFALYDLSLQGVIQALADPETAQLTGTVRERVLFDYAANANYLNAISIIDKNGKVVENSRGIVYPGLNFSDREYFKEQKDHPDIGMYVSDPMKSRVRSGEWIIAISRRIPGPDGTFGGVVVGTLNLAYFDSVFSHLSLGPHGSVAILGSDGALVARKPFLMNDIGHNFGDGTLFQYYPKKRAGRYYASSIIDGIQRRFVFQKIGNLPLVVCVGLALRDIYAPWQTKMLRIGGLMATLGLTILFLAVALSHEFARRKRVDDLLQENAARYRLILENSSDAIVLRTPDGHRKYATPAFYQMIGRSVAEMKHKRLVEFLEGESRETRHETLRRLQAGDQRVAELLRYNRPNGALMWLETISCPVFDATGRVTEVVTTIHDVTRRKAAEDELTAAAATDALTGLANRRCFNDILASEWQRASRSRSNIALLMIDVDYFKAYNDTFGHLKGDEALQMVAACVNSNIRRPTDLGARYGGEEFTAVLPGTDASGALCVAEKIRQAVSARAFAHPYSPVGVVTISIGVMSVQPEAGAEVSTLVQGADTALYKAKQNGRNRSEVALPEMLRALELGAA